MWILELKGLKAGPVLTVHCWLVHEATSSSRFAATTYLTGNVLV